MPDDKGALRTAVDDGVDKLGLDQINFVKEALSWQYNWIGLAGAAAFAIVSGSGLPLVLAAGLELIYLSVVPQSSRFRRLVRSWKYAEERRNHEARLRELHRELSPEVRQRYAELEKIAAAIRTNYARLSSTSQIFVQQMETQLQGLLHSYLRLATAAIQHRDYIQLSNPETIERELTQLQKNLDRQGPKVQEINRKRIEILSKRLEKFQKIRENRQVVEAQCEAIVDVLELIRDQSITMTDPQQVSDRLESLIHEVEQTEETVREVEAIFQIAAPENDAIPPLPSGPQSSADSRSRTRVRN